MAIPQLLTVTFVTKHPDGQRAVNVTHWKVLADASVNSPLWNTLATDFFTVVGPLYASRMSSDCTVEGIYINDTLAPIPLSGKSSGQGFDGLVDERPLSSQLAAVASHRPGPGTWSRTGRTYYPGAYLSALANDTQLEDSYRSDVTALFELLIDGIVFVSLGGSITLGLCLWSSTNGQVDIERTNTRGYFGTQRRRSGLNSGDSPF